MKLAYNWIKSFIDLEASPEQMAEWLTQTGLEVEKSEPYESIPGGLEGLVIGYVLEKKAHPDADKLSLTRVDVGQEEALPIVCGAPNVAQGQKVVVALPGSTIYAEKGKPFKIKKAKIRGEVSRGMICAEDEIGLGDSHEGIMVVDTDLPAGTALTDLFPVERDTIFEIGLTPNRSDGASHLGAARDLKALKGKELKQVGGISVGQPKDSWSKSLRIEDTEACPRYCGVALEQVQVKASPLWLRNRLKSLGLSPKNNVVDITNFILHGWGQPLHAFDADKLEGDVVIRKAKAGETLLTLDDTNLELHPQDLVIADQTGPIALAGIMGGKASAVSEKTENVFLESAYFSPDGIRASSRRHGLKSDASFRYERGTDPEIPYDAAEYAVHLLMEYAGAQLASDFEDVYPDTLVPQQIDLSLAYVDRLVGQHLGRNRVMEILELLDISTEEKSDDLIRCSVPLYRTEVTRPADLVEEILRIYGYNAIELDPGYQVKWVSPHRNNPTEDKKGVIRQRLAGDGFREMMTNSLTKPAYSEAIADLNPADNVPMQNYSSADLSVMRQALFLTGLESVAHNLNHQQHNLRLFEFGKSYHKVEQALEEHWTLAMYLTGQTEGESWMNTGRPFCFQDAKLKAEQILELLGLECESKLEELPSYFAYGLSYYLNEDPVAQVGLLHPKTLQLWDIDQEVFYAELDWERLSVAHKNDFVRFTPMARFPSVRRDLSLVLDEQVSYAEIEKVARRVSPELLQSMRVFDVYKGEHLPEGKKSYSIAFVLQDQNKTLKDKQIAKIMEKLKEAFKSSVQAEIRE